MHLKLSTGVQYRIARKKSDSEAYRVQKVGDLLVVRHPVGDPFSEAREQEVLSRFLMKDQLDVLKQRLDVLAEGWIEERCQKVRLRSVTSRWGSCDRRSGTIMLSSRLLFMDPRLLDYVCVHELAHLKFADHSALFWDLVSRKMPEWKVIRRRLRNFEKSIF